MVLTDCYVKVGTNVFTGKTTSVAVSESAAAVDITAMGDGTKKNVGGLKEWSMAFEFNADEATVGQLHGMLGTEVDVEVRAKSTAVAATNPAYIGKAIITEYSPIDGGVGDKHTVSLSVVSAGPLNRSTTPAV
jgi:hypothetical protein